MEINILLKKVDHTFVIWKHEQNELNNFLNLVKSRHLKIKYTMAIKENQELLLLDV